MILALPHGCAHLYAGALCTERKSHEEGGQRGYGEQENALDPGEAEDTADGGDGGGDTTALTAMGDGEDDADDDSERGGTDH